MPLLIYPAIALAGWTLGSVTGSGVNWFWLLINSLLIVLALKFFGVI